MASADRGAERTLPAETVSPGIACGRAVLWSGNHQSEVPRRELAPEEIEREMGRLDAALASVEGNLRAVEERVRQGLGEDDAKMFEAQILLLRDPSLRDSIGERCSEEKVNLEAAIEAAIKRQAGLLEGLEDPHMRDLSADLRDVGQRLLDYFLEETKPNAGQYPEDSILVAGEVLPSVLAQLGEGRIRGMVVERGGRTAHASILARALQIPLLVGPAGITEAIRGGERVVLDGAEERIVVEPTAATWDRYVRLSHEQRTREKSLRRIIHSPSGTADGVAVTLAANIGLPGEEEAAVEVNADGVGLYRTELAFLAHDHVPTEDEHYAVYCEVAEKIHPRELVIRLLDIGSDKALPFLRLSAEHNPALGRRGTRLLLDHPALLRSQLKAILRTGAARRVSMLFPMITGVDDWRAAKEAVEAAKTVLANEGKSFAAEMRLGVMIETPSSAELLADLADEADFFSVGANDLVQYLLAADRLGDPALFEPLHPAVLRVLGSAAKAAAERGKQISLCGEIAGEPRYVPLLIGLGFVRFSVSPSQLLQVKQVIRATSHREATKLAEEVLTLRSIDEIKARLQAE